MPSAKLRGSNPQAPQARTRADLDVTPSRDEYEPGYAERQIPVPDLPMSQGIANEIDNEIRAWVARLRDLRGYTPSRAEIESFRAELTDRYRKRVPDVEPTPAIDDAVKRRWVKT